MKIVNDKPLPFKFSFLPEVDQVANLLPGDSHVIEKLSFMFRAKFFQRLQFNYDCVNTSGVHVLMGDGAVKFMTDSIETHSTQRFGARTL